MNYHYANSINQFANELYDCYHQLFKNYVGGQKINTIFTNLPKPSLKKRGLNDFCIYFCLVTY